MSKEPLDKIEQSLENALVESGVPIEQIQFGRTGFNTQGRSYVRVGYWKPIDIQTQINLGLAEDEYYDDDCGYKYSYYY
tara:strand:- start:1199 stop:1435 length:237 start_codon:yes stop_codon:yes gene_type:complete